MDFFWTKCIIFNHLRLIFVKICTIMKEIQFIKLIHLFLENEKVAAINLLEEITQNFKRLGNDGLAKKLADIIMEQRKITSHVFNEQKQPKFILTSHLKDEMQILISNLQTEHFINKILFVGPPGTGKTMLAQKLARVLNIPIKIINYNELIDSKLGETNKNIAKLFRDYNGSQTILFFDEFDGISTERTNQNDIFEMARVTTTILQFLDRLDKKTIFIAATNLLTKIDAALIRRMDFVVNFDHYQVADLLNLLAYYENFFQLEPEDTKILEEIICDPHLKQKIYPFEIMQTLKLVKMRKNANFNFINIYQNLLLKKTELNSYEALNEYLIANKKHYSVRLAAELIDQKKFKKSAIALKRGLDNEENFED